MKAIDILKESSVKFPDSPLVIDRNGSLTYSGLLSEVEKSAELLRQAGLKSGMNAALCFTDSREFIIYLFAASACGATVIPLGFDLNANEYRFLIEDFSIDCLIHTNSFNLSNYPVLATGVLRDGNIFSFFKVESNTAKNNFIDAAFIRPTSGTTGKAKGAVFSHDTIFQRIENALKGMNIRENDRVLWVLPMAYHFIVSIVLYVRAGAAVIIPEDKKPSTLISTANRHAASILYAGPLELASLANEPIDEKTSENKLPLLKYAICTVGGLSKNLAEKFSLRHSNPLRQVYGMIEVGLALGNLNQEYLPVESVGKVMHGFEVILLDKEFKEVNEGSVGEIAIKGSGLFDGYYNPHIPRHEITKNGWFLTGDFASKDRFGNFYICGRNKSMLEVEGKKIFCEEIENTINDHPEVKISRVYLNNVEDAHLIAEIETINEVRPDSADIINFCKQRLDKFKIPQKIIFSEKIALTATGKVKRSSEGNKLN